MSSTDSTPANHKSLPFVAWNLQRISTGSEILDSLLGGGLPLSSITDVFGAAATGKTQFAFQNAAMTCGFLASANAKDPGRIETAVVFVDCAGSFRPERIAEIASSRGINANSVLEMISSIYVRSITDQRKASERVFQETQFSECRLLIIDDVTTNFVEELNEPEQIIERQFILSTYIRRLSYIANRMGLSVLLTNSIRSRGEGGESETTGEMLSQYSLFRLLFKRVDRTRTANVQQPVFAKNAGKFEIETRGIVP